MNFKVLFLLLGLSFSTIVMYNGDKRSNRHRLNKQYKKIMDNVACDDYIDLVATTPTHFLSWVFSSILVFGFVTLYLLGKPFNNPNRELGLFLILFILAYLVIYKSLNHFQWHYVKDTVADQKLQ